MARRRTGLRSAVLRRRWSTRSGPPRGPDAPIEDRHRNLAWATQAVYEDAFFHLLNTLQRRYGHSAIALAGGCAYNSVANGKIRDRTAFKQCYLQSAAGDAGGAIGAAYAVWHRNGARDAANDARLLGPVIYAMPNWARC